MGSSPKMITYLQGLAVIAGVCVVWFVVGYFFTKKP